jgi:cytochrome o ubiquinol oxidase operon protein cyoD
VTGLFGAAFLGIEIYDLDRRLYLRLSLGDAAMSAHDHASATAPNATRRGYLTGFALSVILTAIPFWLVMGEGFANKQVIAFVIMGFAAVQMVVHVIYFLHMSSKSEEGWTMLSLVFTLILVVITLAGSLWVMHHLDSNMMPQHQTSERP